MGGAHILVLCRLLQGLSAAGEQAGASSLTLEHAPDHQRSFFTSWTLTGTQGGLVLASLVMIPFVSLPDDAELSWGWRVPFWLSAVVVLIAYFIRRRLQEPPAFADAKASGDIAKVPLLPLLREHWRDVLRVILCAFIAAVSTVFANLAIAYGKKVGLKADMTLWLVVVANVVAMFTQPLFGKLADRIGRKPVFIYGALSSAALMPFYLLSMTSGNDLLMFALAIATFSFGYAAANAVWPSFYGEMFSTKVRFSGLAIGTQLGFLVAGFAPAIVTALGGVSEGGWVVDQYLHRGRLPHRQCCRTDGERDEGRADRAVGPQGSRLARNSSTTEELAPWCPAGHSKRPMPRAATCRAPSSLWRSRLRFGTTTPIAAATVLSDARDHGNGQRTRTKRHLLGGGGYAVPTDSLELRREHRLRDDRVGRDAGQPGKHPVLAPPVRWRAGPCRPRCSASAVRFPRC